MDKILFSITLLLIIFGSTFAQNPSAKLSFEVKATVKDKENIPLAGMSLFVEGDNFKQTVVTDENGVFSIKPPVGRFSIKGNDVVARNFLTYLEIFEDKPNPTNFDLVIETNQTCCTPTSDGKPTEIVKYVFPPYPPAAKAVRASGEVIVNVEIDKDGKVISAKAIGHPLLRTASEVAAKQFLFTRDEHSNIRNGQIVFAFVPCSEKNQINKFQKPNRLEILTKCSEISTSVSH